MLYQHLIGNTLMKNTKLDTKKQIRIDTNHVIIQKI
jgi:hypothetical protein